MSFRLKALLTSIILIGTVIIFFSIMEVVAAFTFSIIFFVILVFFSEELSVPLPREGSGYVSVSYALDLASIIIFGPLIGAFIASLGTVSTKQWKLPWYVIAFNFFQIAVVAFLAGITFEATGGTFGYIYIPDEIIPLICASAIYFLLNTILVTLAIAFNNDQSIWDVWSVNFRWAVPNYVTLAPLGILIVFVYQEIGILGLILLFLPLLVARQSFSMYMKMREAYLSTIKTLSQTLEAKDQYTSGHSIRVAELAKEMGKNLNLRADKLETIEYIAILHDIGKIGVPEQILNKPASLNTQEFEKIKDHPVLGQKIIEDVEFLSAYSSVIRHHHERYDGRGYPDGLKGEEIPMEARIIAVADTFDAMTTKRSYREAIDKIATLREIELQKSKQFDPQVVEALKKVLLAREAISREDLKRLEEKTTSTEAEVF